MDRPAREPIRNARELEFAVFCIENVADAMGLPSDAVYRALTGPSDILNQYIVPNYDMRDGIADMHCMSVPYLVEEILSERENAGDT